MSLPCDVNLLEDSLRSGFFTVSSIPLPEMSTCFSFAWSNRRTHVARACFPSHLCTRTKRQRKALVCFGTVYLAPRACSPRASPLDPRRWARGTGFVLPLHPLCRKLLHLRHPLRGPSFLHQNPYCKCSFRLGCPVAGLCCVDAWGCLEMHTLPSRRYRGPLLLYLRMAVRLKFAQITGN